jgi:hypothetical protein
MTTDDTSKSRDWLDTEPPPIGHNSQAAGVGSISPHSDTDVAALVARHRRVLLDLADDYMSKASPTQDDFLLAAIRTLGVIVTFHGVMGASGEEIAILQKIMTGLKDIGDGRRVRWLEPSRAKGKRGKTADIPEDVAVLRACYAAAVEAMFRQGRGLDDAAHRVADKIHKNSPVRAGTTQVLWKAVRRWRSDYSGFGNGDIGARDLFREMAKRFEEQPALLGAFLANPHASFLKDPSTN